MAGLQCTLRLWRQHRDREGADPLRRGSLAETLADGPAAETERDEALELGRLARELWPGGIAISEEMDVALRETEARISDPAVPAIFDAALQVGPLQGRVDVLERAGEAWRLHAIVPSTRTRGEHLDALAFQAHLVRRAGLEVRGVWLHLLDGTYRSPSELAADEIEIQRLLIARDVTRRVRARVEDTEHEVARWLRVIEAPEPPEVTPSEHCRRPSRCPYFEGCRRPLPDDWVGHFPGLTAAWKAALLEGGALRFAQVPPEQVRTPTQRLALRAAESRQPAFGSDLRHELERLAPPVLYLDFEAWAPVIPRVPGTRPQQVIPFQWSLHRIDRDGRLQHAEFLADPHRNRDPRPEWIEALLAAVAEEPSERAPILVYSSFESDCLADLARDLPPLARAIEELRARLVDLYAIVRQCVYDLSFRGSWALKSVTPALVPGFSWRDLPGIANGAEAQAALARLSRAALTDPQRERMRHQLLAYCERDTWALVELHRALRELAALS